MTDQPALNLDGIKLAFKPNLNMNASCFVPSVKPVVEFSPVKEEKGDIKPKQLGEGLAKQLFAPSPFNPNVVAFKPTIPMPAPTPVEQPKKKSSKKKKPEGEKASKNQVNQKKYVVKGTQPSVNPEDKKAENEPKPEKVVSKKEDIHKPQKERDSKESN